METLGICEFLNDQALSEDYCLPTQESPRVYCDCVLSHNGLGLAGRICDCMDDDAEPTEKWCFWPACSCGGDKCEPWLDEISW